MGSSSQVQWTHQKQGKKSDTDYREKSHTQPCSKRETLTIHPPVYGSAAIVLWIKVHDLKFGCHSFFMSKFAQDAPLFSRSFLQQGEASNGLHVEV